jgi:hypothetical protein
VCDFTDVQFAVQQIGQKGLTGNRVVGGEVRRGQFAMLIDVVGDFVFGEHDGEWVDGLGPQPVMGADNLGWQAVF